MHHQKSKTYVQEICYNDTYQPHLGRRSRPSVHLHRSNIMCLYNKFHISGSFCDLSKLFKHVHHDILLPNSLRSPHQHPVCSSPLLSPLHVTCLAHLILLDLITKINIFARSTEHKTPHYAVIIKFRDVTLTLWTLALILDNWCLLFALRTAVSLLHTNGLYSIINTL
jgi:hypothetical protein